jgi:hypothetical protein
VHQIFKKSPEKPPGQKSEKYRGIVQFNPEMTEVNKVDNYRYIHTPDDQGMGFCEHFHVTIVEKLCLTFIVNFFELHHRFFYTAKIVQNCQNHAHIGE